MKVHFRLLIITLILILISKSFSLSSDLNSIEPININDLNQIILNNNIKNFNSFHFQNNVSFYTNKSILFIKIDSLSIFK